MNSELYEEMFNLYKILEIDWFVIPENFFDDEIVIWYFSKKIDCISYSLEDYLKDNFS